MYVEFVPDSSAIARGAVVGRSGWEQQLAANKQAFVDTWVRRPEFIGSYGNLSVGPNLNLYYVNSGTHFVAQPRQRYVR